MLKAVRISAPKPLDAHLEKARLRNKLDGQALLKKGVLYAERPGQ
jgi:hypothetical protein